MVYLLGIGMSNIPTRMTLIYAQKMNITTLEVHLYVIDVRVKFPRFISVEPMQNLTNINFVCTFHAQMLLTHQHLNSSLLTRGVLLNHLFMQLNQLRDNQALNLNTIMIQLTWWRVLLHL